MFYIISEAIWQLCELCEHDTIMLSTNVYYREVLIYLLKTYHIVIM